MRRLALPFALFVALLAATESAGAPTRSSTISTALYSMRIDVIDAQNSGSLVGTGKIDRAQRLASFDYDGGSLRRQSALISSWPMFSVYSRPSAGAAWQETFAGDTAPLVDPGLALRLDPRAGRVVGTELTDGVRTTKVALAVRFPDAQVLSPSLAPGYFPHAGFPVTLWVDPAGAVRRMHAVVILMSNNYVVSKTIIDERLSSFGTPVRLSRPSVTGSAPPRANLVEAALDRASMDVLSYFSDHHTYVGMTPLVVRNTVDLAFPTDVKIVRTSATTYCIQATLNGSTERQNGPHAPYASGPC